MSLRIALFFLTALVIVNLSCCGFVPFYAEGQRFNPKRVSELTKGTSTKNDVLRLFGDPLERSRDNLYKANWWRYYYSYLGNLGVERAELEIIFDGDTVEDFYVNVKDSRY